MGRKAPQIRLSMALTSIPQRTYGWMKIGLKFITPIPLKTEPSY